MCGIVGFYSKTKKQKDINILKKIMKESIIRGLHSFGIAYTVGNNKKIIVQKAFSLCIDTFLNDFIENGNERLIFHCRYSTSGDFKDMDNNQPILVNNVALALNGVISMKGKEYFEKQFNVKCKTDNDTEIILAQKRNYIKFLKLYPYISFAGLFLKNNKIMALRNNKRPMYTFVQNASRFFISTIDIAYRAGVDRSKVQSVPIMEEMIV